MGSMKATSSKPFAPRRYDFRAEDLNRLRHQERRGWIQIGRVYGCHHTTVLYACKRLGIPTKLKLAAPQVSA